MRYAAALLALTLLGAGATDAVARDRALVIGINEYAGLLDRGAPGRHNLAGAVTDAKTFASLLTDVFKVDAGDIRLLTDGQASRAAIMDGFSTWLIAGSNPGDRVFFYFAGHGATAKVTGEDRLTSTILPADTKGNLGADENVEGMIDGPTVGRFLDQLKDRRVMVVADSCHSGSVTRDIDLKPLDTTGMRTITPRAPVGMTRDTFSDADRSKVKSSTRLIDAQERGAAGANIAVWGAASLDEVAFDVPGGPGGVFTQNFARGLREKAAQQPGAAGVTGASLLSYVRGQSTEFCKGHPGSCRSLTPHLTAPEDYRASLLDTRGAPPPPAPTPAAQVAVDAQGLLAHTNDFALNAEILPGPKVPFRSQVAFRIKSAEPGTLLVLDAGADGKVTQLFPTVTTRKNGVSDQVVPGQLVTIPDERFGQVFRATSLGAGKLLVLVADPKLDLSRIVNRNLDLKPIEGARAIVVEAAEELQKPLITPDIKVDNGAFRYSFVTVPYEVFPR